MSEWRFFSSFLLRATGFPIERLAAVAAPAVSSRDARVAQERSALFAALADDAAREAILTSAPLVDANFAGWRAHAEAGRRNAQDKKRERVLWRFLQRLCAKNDSTSFFGAVAAGSFDRVADVEAVYPIEARRSVYTTQWVVEKLLERAVGELRAAGLHAPARRRAPGVDAEGRRWEPGARGFEQADGDAVVTEVDREALPSGLVDPIGAAIAQLEGEPASALRDDWIARLGEVATLREAFAATAGDPAGRRAALTALEARVSELMAEPAQRGEGEFYVSRGPVHEQADRTGTIVGLPVGWAEGLRAASAPLLELALLMQAPERVVLRRWFTRNFESSRDEPVPWREVLEAIAEAPLALELAAPPEVRRAREAIKQVRAELRAQIDRALATEPGVHLVRLDPEPVLALVRPALAGLGPIGTAYANPDFMIAKTSEGPSFLLAEAHHLPCLTPCLLPSLVHAEAVIEQTRAFLRALTAPDAPAFPASYDHSFISVGPDLGAVGLELSGLAKEPPERRATFAELGVYLDDESGLLRFVVPTHAGETLGVVPMTRTARLHQAAPTFPLSCPDLGRFLAGPDWRPLEALPRLALGDLVVHRRRYRLTPADLTRIDREDVRAYFGEGAPRFMFARMASEPKPILIDWGSALSTELALWALGRGEALELSEMWPDPDGCWLRSPAGHHTAELRTVIVRDG